MLFLTTEYYSVFGIRKSSMPNNIQYSVFGNFSFRIIFGIRSQKTIRYTLSRMGCGYKLNACVGQCFSFYCWAGHKLGIKNITRKLNTYNGNWIGKGLNGKRKCIGKVISVLRVTKPPSNSHITLEFEICPACLISPHNFTVNTFHLPPWGPVCVGKWLSYSPLKWWYFFYFWGRTYGRTDGRTWQL